jgi:hypothetical protein
MFSLVRTGTLSLGSDTDAAALPTHLAECLRSVDARKVEIQGNRIAFRGGMFRLVSNWNVLGPFESGELTIDPSGKQIRYSLNVRQLVVVGTGAVVVMTLFILKSSVWQPLLLVPLMWLWIVGGNLAIGMARFENFVRHAVSNGPLLDNGLTVGVISPLYTSTRAEQDCERNGLISSIMPDREE